MIELRKFVAPEYVVGAGAADLGGRYIRNLGGKKILMVTQPELLELGHAVRVRENLEQAGLSVVVFSNVSQNPRDFEIMAGARVYAREACDAMVAVGGGSPMDAAKSIGIVASSGRHILSFEGVDKVTLPGPPLVCVPTTSGSSADVSQFAIVTDTSRKVKIAIVSKALVPDVALLDPVVTLTMSRELTVYTGLDALVHAIEAYVSNASFPVTDLYALKAVSMIGQSLVRAAEDPDNLEHRAAMSYGSLMAGLAFSNAILGAVHSMAHSLGGMMDLPHGHCNAILLDHVASYNFGSEPERFVKIGRCLGAQIDDDAPRDEQKALVIGAIRELKKRLGVNQTLSELGVKASDIPELARNAMNDPCMVTNPRIPSLGEIQSLYEDAL